MPKVNDTVHIRFSMRGMSGPFWQTNATVAAVSGRRCSWTGWTVRCPR